MRYKQFKNAGVEVSSLAVGTWAIGGQNYGPLTEMIPSSYPDYAGLRRKSDRHSTLLWKWFF